MITFSCHVVTTANLVKFEQEVAEKMAEGFVIQGVSTALIDMTAMMFTAVMVRGKKG